MLGLLSHNSDIKIIIDLGAIAFVSVGMQTALQITGKEKLSNIIKYASIVISVVKVIPLLNTGLETIDTFCSKWLF